MPSEDARRKVYQITDVGMNILKEEARRLRSMVEIAEEYKL